MMYKFYIDGNEVTEEGNISGWQSLKTTIQRTTQGGDSILVTADGDIRFHGDLYEYFLDLFLNQSVCRDFELLILQTQDGIKFTEYYRGKMFLSDFEFDARVKSAKTTIQDNSYFSRINNNKSIKIVPVAGQSKNGKPITPCDIWEMQTFDTITGLDNNTVEAIRVYDLLNYMVRFMSDDEMAFRSDIFNYSGDYEGAFITTGLSLRTETFPDVPFELSWQDIVSELYKNFNTAFEIEINPITLKPILRLEKQDDLYNLNVAYTFESPKDLKIKYKKENMFAKIKIGSTIISEPQQTYLPFPEQMNLISFKPEEYIILGTCNIDSELDLTRKWIVSSNIIHDINVQLEPGWDEEIALIMCDNIDSGGLTVKAKKSNIISGTSTPLFYNEDLYSSNCLLRFYGAIPSTIIKYLGTQDDTFLATLLQNDVYTTVNFPAITTISPYAFGNDVSPPGYDASNNYNNGTYRYVAPTAGIYSFSVSADYQAVISYNGLVYFKFTIKRFDSSNTLISQQSSPPVLFINFVSASQIETGNVIASMTTVLNTGDYVITEMEYQILNITGTTSLTILQSSYFACTNSPNFGGLFQEFDPRNYKALQLSFESPLSMDDIATIISNKKSKFAVNYNDKRYEGWIEKCTLRATPQRQTAEVTLVTSLNYLD